MSSTSATRAASARSRAMSANGSCGRRDRARRAATATSSRASAARKNPPSPFTATIRPAAIVRAAARRASSPWSTAPAAPPLARKARRGPQAGQALGSAWYRRLAGSSYSARHTSQSVNAPIVVHARS
jgi:hypothetical protein